MTKRYLTTRQLCRKLGDRARSSIYLDIKAGRLPRPIKLGGKNYHDEDKADDRMRELSGEVTDDV